MTELLGNPGRRFALRRIALAAVTSGVGLGSASLWSALARSGDLVVFLPGIMGSVLQKGGKDVWALSPESALGALKTMGRNLDALELTEDRLDGPASGDGIVATSLFSDVHLLPGLWKIDGYSGVRGAIGQRTELREGENYFEFPYDWRRDNRVAARRLHDTVPGRLDRWRQASGNPQAKVIFVAHSMGGLVSRYYIECLEGWRITRRQITFGTPYRGSLNALDFLANGYKKDIAGISVADMSSLVRSFTSVYQLLPRYPCVDTGDGVLRRPGEASHLPNVDPAKAAQALEFHREIDRAAARNVGIPEYQQNGYTIHSIVGVAQPTKQAARLKDGKLAMQYELAGTDYQGDGTVPEPSAFPIGGNAVQQDQIKNAVFYISGVHGSLQNLAPVGIQTSNLLKTERADVFRSSARYSVEVDDSYTRSESIRIGCASGRAVVASLSVVDTKGTVKWSQPELSLDAGEHRTIEVPPLSAGTYRVSMAIPSQPTISDVFIVS